MFSSLDLKSDRFEGNVCVFSVFVTIFAQFVRYRRMRHVQLGGSKQAKGQNYKYW